MSTYDMQIKILLIGDSGVGKTSILVRFANDKFSSTFISTIGIDFKIKSLIIKDKTIKLQIWDTGGQERFRTITTSYYRNAEGIVLVYDITDRKSFLSIRNWISQIKLYTDLNVNIILVGSKCDNINERIISYDEGLELSKDYKIDFFECSAKSNININEIFKTITEQVIERLLSKDITKPNITITNIQPIKKRNICC